MALRIMAIPYPLPRIPREVFISSAPRPPPASLVIVSGRWFNPRRAVDIGAPEVNEGGFVPTAWIGVDGV